ncbi:ATP-binding protein [Streptosporangium sp. NPDC023825]|uniref:ATP-binding protein n=1 Tax=Streptosporangium sp. NPDC023825 TaxID=3154909 RepID=UPI003428703D
MAQAPVHAEQALSQGRGEVVDHGAPGLGDRQNSPGPDDSSIGGEPFQHVDHDPGVDRGDDPAPPRRRTFPGRPCQVPEARRFVRFLLADSPLGQDAEQVVAELAANAIRHTASGRPYGMFVVEVVREPEATRVTVYDSGQGAVPALTHPAPLGEGGRGLSLVIAPASRVGYQGTRSHGHAV